MSDNTLSIEELKRLVNFLKIATQLTAEELAVRAGYNEGYISQCFSRGKVPTKFVEALKREFKSEIKEGESEIAIDSRMKSMTIKVRQMEALLKTVLNAHAKLEARVSGRKVGDVLDDLEQTTQLNLRDSSKAP